LSPAASGRGYGRCCCSTAASHPNGPYWSVVRSYARCSGLDSLAGPLTLGALAATDHPVHLIAAARGAHDRAGPFLSDAALTAGRSQLPRLTTERADVNHLTLLFDPLVPKAIV
jgi:hypothetical protein